MLIAAVVAGVVIGAVIVWLALRSQTAGLQAQVEAAQQALAAANVQSANANDERQQLGTKLARAEADLQHERESAQEKLALVTRASEDLRNAFSALATQALQTNNQSFLDLARTHLEAFQAKASGDLEQRQKAVENLVAPIKDSLTRFEAQVQSLERSRSEAYGGLLQQVKSLATTQEKLQSETMNLVRALRAPNVRGRWGEIQLRRVVEIAGMVPYCDFTEQASVTTADGRLRPDLIVRLPGGKNIVVDAKTPLAAYLEACETQDDALRAAKLTRHAEQVREHMNKLASKGYWEQFQPTPEFVVMFLPGETFFSSALEQNPALIEQGVAERVIPASPTTLIALLRAVAYGWQQETIAENAQRMALLGKDLYERLCKFADHMEGVGKGLDRAVDSYNKAVGTIESRIFAPARKLAEYGAAVKTELPELAPVESTARELQSADWSEPELMRIAAAAE